MNWVERYQLFLFDCDGLLVNTEELHYKAYQKMCSNRNIDLSWSFLQYASLAHFSSDGVREALYKEFPALQKTPWEILYDEKKAALLEFIEAGKVELMTGVAELLNELNRKNIPRCVVTHSPISLIDKIRKQNPVLNTIPHWITREDYSQPKPSSECYNVAIARYGKPNDKIIGFEDAPRGLEALSKTKAIPVMVCPKFYPYVEQIVRSGQKYYSSFQEINERNCP